MPSARSPPASTRPTHAGASSRPRSAAGRLPTWSGAHGATSAVRADFRATLSDVEPTWVARLIAVRSAAVDDFVVWLLANVPRFEQGAFRDLGHHAPVLSLLDSPSNDARVYAAAYARTHARDL